MLVLQALVFPVFADSILMSNEMNLCNENAEILTLYKDFTYAIKDQYGTILFDGQWEWIEENQSIKFIYESEGNIMEMQAEITDKILSRDESRIKITELELFGDTYKADVCY